MVQIQLLNVLRAIQDLADQFLLKGITGLQRRYEVIRMRHSGLGLMACLLLVGMGVAQDGFEHKEFTNQEGMYLSYNINNIGLIENGKLTRSDGVVLTFMGSTGEPLEYESSSGTTGILQFKPYDNTFFDLDVHEGDYVVATYRFEGNFYSSDSPNYMVV